MKLFWALSISFSLFVNLSVFAAGDGTSPLPSSTSGISRDCVRMLAQTGELVSISDLRTHLKNMEMYLAELEAHHGSGGTVPYGFATPDTARALEAVHGPIVTFTTFSRELASAEHFQLANHFSGFLSSLPRGGVIVTSGGTMGERSNANGTGGGVGVVQKMAMAQGFKTLSITASRGFGYRAAPADFLLFSLGGFGSESRMMYELSKALVVIGGGGQAFNEATEYLLYHKDGVLIIVDDPTVGGSGHSLAKDPTFQALAAVDPRIIIAKNGTDAGMKLAARLGIKIKTSEIMKHTKDRLNIVRPDVDLHMLIPGSKVVGFSGWSDFKRAGNDVMAEGHRIRSDVETALEKIHNALAKMNSPLFYVTAGNDPTFEGTTVPAFETMVHKLPLHDNVRYVGLTASKVSPDSLNERIKTLSFISPSWEGRTQQMMARIDSFVTSGGNQTVVEQAIQAANLQAPHLHILGANTLTDLRMSKIKNPNLVLMTPEQVLRADDAELQRILGMK